MPRVFATDIVETSSTLGVTAYTLDGPRIGYRSFAEGYISGDTPYYVVRNATDTKYEHNRKGIYTKASPDTLSRNVLYSSNGNAPVPWVAGDLPLIVYVPSAIEVLDQLTRDYLGEVRDAYIQFGHWFDSSVPGKAIWKIFDGAADVTVGTVDLATHTLILRDFPAGIVQMYAGAVAPTGFLLCEGQAVSRLIYSELFSKIGGTYGGGDGTTTFNIPDFRGRTAFHPDKGVGRLTSAGFGNNATLGMPGGNQQMYYSISQPAIGVNVGSWFGGGGYSAAGYTGGSQSIHYGANTWNTDGWMGIVGSGPATGSHGHYYEVHANTSGESLSVAINSFGASGGTVGWNGTTGWGANVPPGLIMNYIISTGGV